MKNYLLALCFMIAPSICLAQNLSQFLITETVLHDTTHRKLPTDFKRNSLVFFEDDQYSVRKSCSGEWGGSVWFTNKKTGVVRGSAATCPVIINKLNGRYFVSATLDHMNGSTQVLEIDNPTNLVISKKPRPAFNKKGQRIFYVGSNESDSQAGTKVLVDTSGVLLLLSFLRDNKLYNIITDYKHTYLAKIVNKRFVTVCLISQESIWTYEPDVIMTRDFHLIVFFTNPKTDGYLDVVGNNIHLLRYR